MKRLLAFLLLFASSTFAQVVPGGNPNNPFASGISVPGCTISSIVYIDASGNLACARTPVNGSVSTAGRSILTIRDTVASGQAMFDITGTFNGTLSGETSAMSLGITLDNDAQIQNGFKVSMSGASGTTPYAIRGTTSATGTYSIAMLGEATGNATNSIGVMGSVTAGTSRVPGYFTLGSIVPNPPSSTAIYVDNSSVAAPIAIFADNGTPVFTIADTGAVTWTNTLSPSGSAYMDIGPNSAGSGAVLWATAVTPDSPGLFTGTTSNSLLFAERGDSAFDFQNPCTTGLGTSACTDPTLIIHSHNQDTGEFASIAHDGKAGVIAGGDSTSLNGQIRLGGSVALPDTTATTVINVASANTTGTGGTISYTLTANDATNAQERTGQVRYSVATNNAGTTSCAVYGVDNAATVNPTQTADGSGAGIFTAGAGTLTLAWSVTAGTNTCAIKIGAISSLTETTMRIDYVVLHSGRGAVTGG